VSHVITLIDAGCVAAFQVKISFPGVRNSPHRLLGAARD